MPDKTLVCKTCKAEFVFSEQEQEQYLEKGYRNEPTRCEPCRAATRKPGQPDGRNGSTSNYNGESYTAICAECGKTTTLPFKPSPDKPVYCRTCYKPKKR